MQIMSGRLQQCIYTLYGVVVSYSDHFQTVLCMECLCPLFCTHSPSHFVTMRVDPCLIQAPLSIGVRSTFISTAAGDLPDFRFVVIETIV